MMATTNECNSVCSSAKEKVAECWYVVLLQHGARGMIFNTKEIADSLVWQKNSIMIPRTANMDATSEANKKRLTSESSAESVFSLMNLAAGSPLSSPLALSPSSVGSPQDVGHLQLGGSGSPTLATKNRMPIPMLVGTSGPLSPLSLPSSLSMGSHTGSQSGSPMLQSPPGVSALRHTSPPAVRSPGTPLPLSPPTKLRKTNAGGSYVSSMRGLINAASGKVMSPTSSGHVKPGGPMSPFAGMPSPAFPVWGVGGGPGPGSPSPLTSPLSREGGALSVVTSPSGDFVDDSKEAAKDVEAEAVPREAVFPRVVHTPRSVRKTRITHPALLPQLALEVAEEIVRYQWYIMHGVDEAFIAPIKESWLSNTRALVSRNWRIPGDKAREIMSEIEAEVCQDYILSVKKGIVDYVLRDESERKRLGLTTMESVMRTVAESMGGGGAVPAMGGKRWGPAAVLILTADWCMAVRLAGEALLRDLHRLSPHTLELVGLWEKVFDGRAFVDVGQMEFMSQMPFTVNGFLECQISYGDQVKQTVEQEWLPSATNLFTKSPPEPLNRDLKGFYTAVAVLMSIQLRRLVENTVTRYHDFFAQYGKATNLRNPKASKRVEEAGITRETRKRSILGVDKRVFELPTWLKPVFVMELQQDKGVCR
ncbi:hypothetical protein CBR_g51373 [Chara braunii]|uniref:Uncharacterized protein n=1 Tax=Chara braunii TaxID=69332 RepID=A0A388M8E9_CHABU|nr:hypothetical protein CBR_g51373 [Chara braunii]|eukprot:GBG90867.1 hypothetical protein CBR_g51373 [Chara braunii]